MFSLRRSLLATLFPYTTLFRSGVVDTVADHGHGPALVLEAADHVDLVLGHDPGDDALDADLGGHALGDGLVITGQQHRVQTQVLEPPDGVGAGGDRKSTRLHSSH